MKTIKTLAPFLLIISLNAAAVENVVRTIDFEHESYHLTFRPQTASYRIDKVEFRDQEVKASLLRSGSWTCEDSEIAYQNNKGRIGDYIYQSGRSQLQFDVLRIFNEPQQYQARLKELAASLGIESITNQTRLRIEKIEITPVLNSGSLFELATRDDSALSFLRENIRDAVERLNKQNLNHWTGSLEIGSYAAYCDLIKGRLHFDVQITYTLITEEIEPSVLLDSRKLGDIYSILNKEPAPSTEFSSSMTQVIAKSRQLERTLQKVGSLAERIDDPTFIKLWHLFYETPSSPPALKTSKWQSFLYSISDKKEMRTTLNAKFRTNERNTP